MTKSRVPGWFGWPSNKPAPGSAWIPGEKFRILILLLTYSFLAFSLTINYVASSVFFMLAILGFYIGLRRGFLNGLSAIEKIIMAIFAVYPIIAIASYIVGMRTDVGFRFLGRDLRLCLFIPVFLAIRWSYPREKLVGLSFAACSAFALIIALLQRGPWPSPLPHGVTGTHITFGDLTVLSGFLAMTFLWPIASRKDTKKRTFAVLQFCLWIVVGIAILTTVVADARGAWLSIPALAATFFYANSRLASSASAKRRIAISVVTVVIVLSSLALPVVRNGIARAVDGFSSYIAVDHFWGTGDKCVDTRSLLKSLISLSNKPKGGLVYIAHLSSHSRRQIKQYGCIGGYALALSAYYQPGNLKYLLFSGDKYPAEPENQMAKILTLGKAKLKLGGAGQWQVAHSEAHWGLHILNVTSKNTQPIYFGVASSHRVLAVPLDAPNHKFSLAIAESSIGQRLFMWQTAVAIGFAHPLLGVGTGAFHEAAALRSAESPGRALIGDYQHAHSDYLTEFATNGIAGLLSFITLILAPFIGASISRGTPSKHSVRLSANQITLAFLIFAITETMFIHSFVITWYTVVTAVVLTMMTKREKNMV